MLLAAMHAQGVKKLSGADAITPSEFSSAFPDQGSWMDRLQRRGCGPTLADFFQDVQYDGRPELFAMHTCLLLCRSMRLNPEWIRAHRRELTRAMLAQFSDLGLCRVPALCVKDFS